MASSAEYPNNRSALLFQLMMMPFKSLRMMASSDESTMALSKADEDKMGPALSRIAEEDPTFKFRRDSETGQTVVSGQGDTHLSVVIERLKRLGANVHEQEMKIPYRETIQ